MSIDLTLDRLRRLVSHLPRYTRPTCHIAGTNGKGSVVSLIASILRSTSPPLSVGRFNSPHLVTIYDCIVINGEPITPQVYDYARQQVEAADKEHETKLSSFELLTLTALLVFEQAEIDIAVIEVGMGGRLDATNIIPDETVLVSALTAVDLDHQAFLGDTIAAIAREKAGIARKGKPFVLGPQRHGDVESIVKDVVQEVGGQLVEAVKVEEREWDERVDGPRHPEFSLVPSRFRDPPPQAISASLLCFPHPIKAALPLYGPHQLDNLSTALGVISSILTHPSCAHLGLETRITPSTIAHGIKAVRWPGRLSFHTIALPSLSHPLVVLADGAHNPASATTLGEYITYLLSLLESDGSPRKINLAYVLGLSHSPPKTPAQTLSSFVPPTLPASSNLELNVLAAALSFTPPAGMPWVKSVPPSAIAAVVKDIVPAAEVWVGEEEGQLTNALEWVASRTGKADEQTLVILAGSLYLVADFYRMLGRLPL